MEKIKPFILTIVLFTFTFAHAMKPIILWDLHEVLLQPKNRITTFLTFSHLKETLSSLSWPLAKNLLSLIAQNMIQDISSEEYIRIARTYNNPHLIELIITLVNSQQLNPGMKEIVQTLTDEGYEQHIGSNIGETAFRRLLDANRYPSIAPIFKHMNLEKSMVTRFENGEIVKKPDVRYFHHYLAKNEIDLEKTPVIFIDDDADNIRTARSLGFDAIRFKTPELLRMELKKRNIPIKAPPFVRMNPNNYHCFPSFACHKPVK